MQGASVINKPGFRRDHRSSFTFLITILTLLGYAIFTQQPASSQISPQVAEKQHTSLISGWQSTFIKSEQQQQVPHHGVVLARDCISNKAPKKREFKKEEGDGKAEDDEQKVEMRRLKKRMGSRPPMCRDKCQSCFPCEAVQLVPTPALASVKHAAVPHYLDYYSNYDPEGWKCKCGTRIFNP